MLGDLFMSPLVWNSLMHMTRRRMLGSKPHVSWGAMAPRTTKSLGDWLHFLWLPKDDQQERLVGMHGNVLMISDILEAIPKHWTQQ